MKHSIIAALFLAAAAGQALAEDCAAWTQAGSQWTCVIGPAGAGNQESAVSLRDAAALKAFIEKVGLKETPAVDFRTHSLVAFLSKDDGAFKLVKVARGSETVELRQARAIAGETGEVKAAQARVAQVVDSSLQAPAAARAGALTHQGYTMAALTGAQAQGLRDALSANVVKTAACTPGVDCPEAPRQQSPRRPACTPGVDCPEAPRQTPRQPSCTPGVDCPGSTPTRPSCTRGVDCPGDRPNNGGTHAPPPPNYRARPSTPPSTFPSFGSPTYYDNQVAGIWHNYVMWGRYEERYGNYGSIDSGSLTVTRGGKEVGTQGTVYTGSINTTQSRRVYRLNWRYVGSNCNPNDSSQCMEWGIQYAYIFDRWESRNAGSANVEVRYVDDAPLLPWEKDVVTVTYDGSRLSLSQTNTAFNYAVTGPTFNAETGRNVYVLKPQARNKRAPESDKVTMELVKQGNQIVLQVKDARAQVYQGEPLEIQVEVTNPCIRRSWGFCVSDKTFVRTTKVGGAIRIDRLNGQSLVQESIPVTSVSGKYQITWQAFRRPESQLSTDAWITNGWNGPVIQN